MTLGLGIHDSDVPMTAESLGILTSVAEVLGTLVGGNLRDVGGTGIYCQKVFFVLRIPIVLRHYATIKYMGSLALRLKTLGGHTIVEVCANNPCVPCRNSKISADTCLNSAMILMPISVTAVHCEMANFVKRASCIWECQSE